MKLKLRTKTLSIVTLTALMLLSFKSESSYKCMIQLTNYNGEGAYVTISLLNPEGTYEKTLYVQGADEDWYTDIKEWWKFHSKNKSNIDAITGATVGGGGRTISVIQIDDSKINKGYTLRFESAVEDKEYYKDDVEIELTFENLKSKFEGKGFIRYVRIMPQL